MAGGGLWSILHRSITEIVELGAVTHGYWASCVWSPPRAGGLGSINDNISISRLILVRVSPLVRRVYSRLGWRRLWWLKEMIGKRFKIIVPRKAFSSRSLTRYLVDCIRRHHSSALVAPVLEISCPHLCARWGARPSQRISCDCCGVRRPAASQGCEGVMNPKMTDSLLIRLTVR